YLLLPLYQQKIGAGSLIVFSGLSAPGCPFSTILNKPEQGKRQLRVVTATEVALPRYCRRRSPSRHDATSTKVDGSGTTVPPPPPPPLTVMTPPSKSGSTNSTPFSSLKITLLKLNALLPPVIA